MKFTGERFIPTEKGNIYLEHYHRYYAINEIIKNKLVLDIACGEGYGSHLISGKARNVIGIDISEVTIKGAQKKYTNKNLRFIHGSATAIPLEDHSVDVVVSFETIEHHTKHEEMLSEIKRVLKKDGVLVMSSPDKTNYNKTLSEPNRFHVKELEFPEFKTLIDSYFKVAIYFFQKLSYGSLITGSKEDSFSYYSDEISNKTVEFNPVYDLCIASDIEITDSLQSFLDGTEFYKQVIENYKSQIERIHKSATWRVGRVILSPFSILKSK